MNWKTAFVFLAAAFIVTRGSRRKGVMLSKNFSLGEFTKSQAAKQMGIINVPGPTEVSRLQALVLNVLQPLRTAMGYPVIVKSGYRSSDLNLAIGGAVNSSHMKGEAADIVGSNKAQMFNYIKDNLPFDQLIWEKGNNTEPEWIHVSYKSIGNRKQVLQYIPGQGYLDI